MYPPRQIEYNIETSIAMTVAALETGNVSDKVEDYMRELLNIDKHERVSRFHPNHSDLPQDDSEGIRALRSEWGSGGGLQRSEEGDT